jgi:hypothetical protein
MGVGVEKIKNGIGFRKGDLFDPGKHFTHIMDLPAEQSLRAILIKIV